MKLHSSIAAYLLVFSFIIINCASAQTDQIFRVTLLGTGVPAPSSDRMGASTLVQVGSHNLLFDVGRGASIRIIQAGLGLKDISGLFITHLHADHVVGLPDFWLTGYKSGRKGDLKVYGPVGTKAMADGLEKAYAGVIEYWGIAKAEPGFAVKEFSVDNIIFEDGDLKVTAFKVKHSPTSNLDAYGYKIVYKGKSVVISGDTGYSDNLITYAKGTDLLIHEVFTKDETGIDPAFLRQLRISHTVPDVAAKIFSETKPKVAVAYHLDADTDPDVVKSIISKTFNGRFYLGYDLMCFNIEESVELIRNK